jgi:hypothetical protein
MLRWRTVQVFRRRTARQLSRMLKVPRPLGSETKPETRGESELMASG